MCIFYNKCFLTCTAYLEIKTASAGLSSLLVELMLRCSCLTASLGSVLNVMEPQSNKIHYLHC